MEPFSEVIQTYPPHFTNDVFQEASRYFALHTIDGNEVLLMGVREDHFHITFLEKVYVLQNGVVIQQKELMWGGGEFWGSLAPVLFENGTIRVGRNNEDDLIFFYYRFEDGELEFQISLTEMVDGRFLYRNTTMSPAPVNSITREEFERLRQEMEGNGQTVEFNWHPLAELG